MWTWPSIGARRGLTVKCSKHTIGKWVRGTRWKSDYKLCYLFRWSSITWKWYFLHLHFVFVTHFRHLFSFCFRTWQRFKMTHTATNSSMLRKSQQCAPAGTVCPKMTGASESQVVLLQIISVIPALTCTHTHYKTCRSRYQCVNQCTRYLSTSRT